MTFRRSFRATPRSAYPFVDSNFNQTSSKIVYLSPTFAGFQFAAAFTPNQTVENYSPAITSTPTTVFQANGGQPKNLIDIGGQYTQTFGPVGVQIGADYQYASQVAYTGSEAAVNNLSYKDLNIVSGGATATIAGLTFGGNAVYGAFNGGAGAGSFELEPDGGSAAVAFLLGMQYHDRPARGRRQRLPLQHDGCSSRRRRCRIRRDHHLSGPDDRPAGQ